MKNMKKFLFAVLSIFVALAVVACQPADTNAPTPKHKGNNGESVRGGRLTPKDDIAQLKDLKDYGKDDKTARPTPKTYDPEGKTYDGKSCSDGEKSPYERLRKRIDEKRGDVESGDSKSAFVKIFALSNPDGLLAAMAKASLEYDEMTKVTDYLAGWDDADEGVEEYIKEETVADGASAESGKSEWTGIFAVADGSIRKWRDEKSGKADKEDDSFCWDWSFFDDWELYDGLRDYADWISKEEGYAGESRDIAGDNAAWQYRIILKKMYSRVGLKGDAAARLAAYMLEYAVKIVEERSGGLVPLVDADFKAGAERTSAFIDYCKKKIDFDDEGKPIDPFSGLEDYETLSYLSAFWHFYNGDNRETESDKNHVGSNIKQCVKLYGYYYDYNKTYYNKSLADADVYEKQLKYEKMDRYTDEEWSDYVKIQRDNYVNAYRYKNPFYSDFYSEHFTFQGLIEEKDELVYKFKDRIIADLKEKHNPDGYSAYNAVYEPPNTYTKDMKSAIAKEGSVNGLAGQLALSDWMWCYFGDETSKRAYNSANTQYQEGKDSNDSEKEYEGKFKYETEQLYLVEYLLTRMSAAELSGALYYNVYGYSASMMKSLYGDLKNIAYIDNRMKPGADYTNVDEDAISLLKAEKPGSGASGADARDFADEYAIGKIRALYMCGCSDWKSAEVKTRAENAGKQGWKKMRAEIDEAIKFDYDSIEFADGSRWKKKCEYLEDNVIAREWSCCHTRVTDPAPESCSTHGITNSDGTQATKEYCDDHTISKFVSDYEPILLHVGGSCKVDFHCVKLQKEQVLYKIDDGKEHIWADGYALDPNDKDLKDDDMIDPDAKTTFEYFLLPEKDRDTVSYKSTHSFTVGAGKTFQDAYDEDFDNEDKGWWETNMPGKEDTVLKIGDKRQSDEINQTKTDFAYEYKFRDWYLDKECRFKFNENDDIERGISLYPGYRTKKKKANATM